MLANGCQTFYQYEDDIAVGYYRHDAQGYVPFPDRPRELKVAVGALVLLALLTAKQAFGQSEVIFQDSGGANIGYCAFCAIKEGTNITITRSGGVYTFSATLSGSGIVSLNGETNAVLQFNLTSTCVFLANNNFLDCGYN